MFCENGCRRDGVDPIALTSLGETTMPLALWGLMESLTKLPIEYLVILVALAGLGVAALAIHAVYSIAKGRR